jgi:diguanylate cyclase
MSTPLPNPTETDWKERYFRALFELDEKDRVAGERLADMARPLSRLLSALKIRLPQHAVLVDELHQALEARRTDAALSAPALNLAAALESSSGSGIAQSAATDAGLYAGLKRGLPEAQVELDALWSRAPKDSDDTHTVQAWLGDLQRCLKRHLGESDQGVSSSDLPSFETEPLLRFLGNLRGLPPLDSHIAQVRELIDSTPDRIAVLREVDELAARLSNSLMAEDGHPIESQREMMIVAQNLEGLLNRIDFPGDLVQRVQSLRVLLGSAASRNELQTAVGQFGELVRTAMRLSRRELQDAERFLNDVLQRLEAIQGHVASERDSHNVGRRHRDDLRQAVGTNVVKLQEHLQKAPSIAELKITVAEALHGINHSVTHFIAVESERANAAEAKIQSLQEHMEVLEREADALRTSMQQEHLRATRDPLTGVANRLAYEDRLHFEFERWKRYGTALSLVVVDVDYFKSINDKFGHQTGDRVLRAVAAQLVRNVRETDFIARYGGEEFVVLLPNTSVEAAAIVADKLRSHVSACRFQHREENVTVTVSCGVAGFHPDDSTETVFQRADDALYRAKHAGRNQVQQECMEDAD